MELLGAGREYDVAGVKARLSRYMDTERDIDSEIERLERLQSKLYGTSSKKLSDMPRAPSPVQDRMAQLLARKDELEREIRDMIAAQDAERAWINHMVVGLRRSEQRSVIRMRYLDGERWTDVCALMFGDKEDYCDREDSYLRRVMTLHGQALLNMAKMVSEEAG